MVKKEFHNQHSNGTKVKLEIFDKYFNECLPVFIHTSFCKDIFIYDLFAGKGKDQNGEFGTSLNIIRGVSRHCHAISEKNKRVYIILNDKEQSNELSRNVDEYLASCKCDCDLDECVLKHNVDAFSSNVIVKSEDFTTYFNNVIYPVLCKRKECAKIIFLDPFNFIMDDTLFKQLTSLKSTDYLCFMPSSYLRRFKKTDAFNSYIDKDKLLFDESRPNECHRVIARYFESLVADKEYYVGYFSIKYNKNIYGIIFGSNHSFGAEKFQKVCWDIDNVTGEADYNIDKEIVYNGQQSLFEEHSIPRKIKEFNELLTKLIKDKMIITDVDAYKFALKNRCLPKHAADVLKQLMNQGVINVFKTKTSDIHKIKIPTNIVYNETV